jgi:hypothetical protein
MQKRMTEGAAESMRAARAESIAEYVIAGRAHEHGSTAELTDRLALVMRLAFYSAVVAPDDDEASERVAIAAERAGLFAELMMRGAELPPGDFNPTELIQCERALRERSAEAAELFRDFFRARLGEAQKDLDRQRRHIRARDAAKREERKIAPLTHRKAQGSA